MRSVRVVQRNLTSLSLGAGNRQMDKTGILSSLQDQMMVSAEECATALIKLIQGATREKDGGEFLNFDGTKIPW